MSKETVELHERVALLRARLGSEEAAAVGDILDTLSAWVFRFDDEIDELDSRIRFLEHLQEEQERED